jgi:O-antigen ligase
MTFYKRASAVQAHYSFFISFFAKILSDSSMIQKISSPTIWIIAFTCGLFFVNSWQLELFAAAVITTFFWSFITLNKTNKWEIPNSWPLKIMAAFWFLVFLSVLGSDILSVSLMAFCFFSVMPLTFLTLTISNNKNAYIKTAKLGLAVYALLAIWALVQFFIFGEYFEWRIRHPLNNPNSLSALLSLGFFCSLGCLLACKKNTQKRLALVLAILLFGGIVVSGSRGALYALVPIVTIYLFCIRDTARTNIRELIVLFVCSISFFVLTFLAESQGIFNRMISDIDAPSLNHYTNNRLSLWLASFEIIKNYGVFGTGIGTYFLYFPEYRLVDDALGTHHAHNDPLQYWVELGFLGPVLFYAFIISMIGRTIQAVKKSDTQQQKLLILTPFFALGAMVIHTHVTFNLYNLSILFVSGFLLALWFFSTQQVLKTKTVTLSFPKTKPIWTKTLLLGFPFIIIGSIFTAYIAGEHFTDKARAHMLSGELEEFTADVLFAQKIAFHGNYRPYLLATNIPLSILEDQKRNLTSAQKKETTQIALRYIQHVQHINPRSASSYFQMGKLVNIGDKQTLSSADIESADFYFRRALQLDPLHIGARLEVAKILRNQNKPNEALDILEAGSHYRYKTSNAINLYSELAIAHLINGNKEKQDFYLKKMQKFQDTINKQMEKEKETLKTHLFHNSKA